MGKNLSLEDGAAAASQIVGLRGGDLLDRGKVTRLPYPGLGLPTGRPPLELRYIGTKSLFHLCCEFMEGAPRVVIAGPRGYGKSSDLRALSVYVYKSFYVERSKKRLVCIWNMAAAINDVVQVLRDAIVFAYLVAAKHTVAVDNAAATAADNTDAAADNEIQKAALLELEVQKIASVEDAIGFIKDRKRAHQEVFHFFVDGWELIDEMTNSTGECQPRKKQRAQVVHSKLEALFSEGKQVFFSASAKSNAVKPAPGVFVYHKIEPFDNVQFASYSSSSILGKLSNWQNDIDFYTGRVPLFLDVLCDCCTKYLRHTAKQVLWLDLSYRDSVPQAKMQEKLAPLRRLPDNDQEIVELLEDENNWQVVLQLFREHEELKQVEASIDRITLNKSCHSIEEMGKKDATYFIVQEQRYCSSFIHRMYLKAFRAKEAQFYECAGGAWIPYCGYLLLRSNVNWSDVGWVLEDLVADVVTNRQVDLGKTLGIITGCNLKLEEFTEVPEVLISKLLKAIPGHGTYWKPRLFSFPYVDGVVGYVDMRGCLHIIGLQVSVSVDQHLLSARLFMSYQYLNRWFPDLEAQLAAAKVQLHFVYIGCSDKHKHGLFEEDIEERMIELIGGKSIGTAAHKWTFVPLNKALASLDGEEKEVVGEVAARRQLRLPRVPLSLAALYPLRRKELDEIAVQYGLDPKQYKYKDDVIGALVGLL